MKLLEGFEWKVNVDYDIVERFFRDNYVELGGFRFDYLKKFLELILDMNVGIMSYYKLWGFIGYKKIILSIYNKEINVVEINFLCVDKLSRN